MNVNMLNIAKNIFVLIIKFLLLLLLLYALIMQFVAFISVSLDDFDNYSAIRGLYNYGIETEAEYVEKPLTNGIKETELYQPLDPNYKTYRYKIENEYKFVELNVDSVDKTKEIVYDELNPTIVVKKESMDGINAFYKDKMIEFCKLFFMSYVYILIYGICWFLLDLIKYRKVKAVNSDVNNQ